MPKFLVILFLLICSTFSTKIVGAQQSQISFGKNRVQYKEFDFQYYDTENFRVYFYQGGQDMGRYVVMSAEQCIKSVKEVIDFNLSEKLEIIVYNDISDMHQTNIGVKSEVDRVSGNFQINNNKLFVYFNGKHQHLDLQLRKGIAELIIQQFMFDGGIQEVFTKSFTQSIPNWFVDGYINYIAQPWNVHQEEIIRQGILSGDFANLSKLDDERLKVVGHSLILKVESDFGKDAVANLLYLTKINRSVERGFFYVTGTDFDAFLKEWYIAKKEQYEIEEELLAQRPQEEITLKKHKNFDKYLAEISPDGKFIAYLINDIGRWKVLIYDVQNEKTQTLKKGGFRTITLETDLSNPMIAWDPAGKKLSVVYEKKDMFYLMHYLAADNFKPEAKPDPFRKFQKIFDFSYAQDSRNLLLSAMQKSQIDIFQFYIPTHKVTNLTDDFYDDLQVSFYKQNGRQGALFVSNRPDDVLLNERLDSILPNNNFDIFFIDFNNPIQKLSQITFTPYVSEMNPQFLNDSTYTYLVDNGGIITQYQGFLEQKPMGNRLKYVFELKQSFGDLDSIVLDFEQPLEDALAYDEELKRVVRLDTVPLIKFSGTNQIFKKYNQSIVGLSIATKKQQQLEAFYKNNNMVFTISDIQASEFILDDTASYIKMLDDPNQSNPIKTIHSNDSDTSHKDSIIIEKKYQSKFDTWDTLSPQYQNAINASVIEAKGETGQFKFTRTRQYFLKFMTENVSANFDNSLLVTNYQPFNPGSPQFNQPGMNPMLKFGVTDLFENHKIYGGIRMPLFGGGGENSGLPFKVSVFENIELFVTYENLKKRIDKSLTFYHKHNSEIVNITYPSIAYSSPGVLTTKTNLVESKFTYPFNQLNSLRLKVGFRNDRFIVRSTELAHLLAPNSSQNYLFSRLEFVHDHTLPVAKNIQYGFKANVYYEVQKEFPTREDTVLNQSVQLPVFNNQYLMLWGFDLRHYQKVHKTIIWANRLAYSTSVGTKKMIYYLGGTEGMLFPNFDTTNIVNTNNNYAFQSLAVNMHGFSQNIRNGNSFMVLNSELRVPIFTAFSNRPPKSQFLENIQLIGFFDVGTAWEGITPFSNGNIAQEVRENAVSTARLNIYKQPIVMGFGLGLRAEIMGYFLRGDLGWGYDTGNINKPRFQFAIGYDF